MTKLLLDAGADPNVEDCRGQTPLSIAEDLNGEYPLSAPCPTGSWPKSNYLDRKAVVNLLIDAGAKHEQK